MRGSVLRIGKSYQRLRAFQAGLLIVAGLVVGACSRPQTVVDSVHTLNQRIANTLSSEAAQLSYQPRPAPMPTIRSLKPVGEPAAMNFLTSLRLGHCEAGQLIAQRNSSLGRLEDGLMRYHDDVQLLSALRTCAQHPQSETIKAELQRAIADKHAQLSFDKAHAIATDKALRHVLSIGAKSLATLDDDVFNHQLNALLQLVEWLAQAPQQPAPAETSLARWRQQLAQADYLPRLLRSTIEMRLLLTQLQQQLPPLTAAAGCDGKGVPERAKVLQRVFMRFFIDATQSKLAQLTTQYQQLQPVLLTLAEAVPQPALQDYLRELSRQGQKLNQTSKAFVQPWQQLFMDCGFTPGQNSF